MATETLCPNANGDSSQCMNSASDHTNNYAYVDEVEANDADFVYAIQAAGNYLDLYNLPATEIPEGSTINKITFYARFKSDAGANFCKFAYKSGGTVYYSAAPDVTTSYDEYPWEQTTNQKTSAAWTLDDINSLQIGENLEGEYKGDYGSCSRVKIEIDYTEAAGGLAVKHHYYQKMMG